MNIKLNKITAFLLICILFGGCASVQEINEKTLVALYAKKRNNPKNVVIFIPGMMGTVLKDKKTGRTVWGEVGKRLIDALALPIDAVTLIVNRDSLVASKPLSKITVVPGLVEKGVYDRISRLAVDAGGYKAGENAFSLSYDWRRDLVEAAQSLEKLVEEIKQKTGDPNIKITLLCHSAGGLIARYYIKYGAVDVLNSETLPKPTYAGAKNIGKVIMLGVPNGGSFEAFERLHRGLHIPIVGYFSPEVVFTMPSIYEFLPFDSDYLFVDENGGLLNIDIYASQNWKQYGWSIFNPRRQNRTLKKLKFIYGAKKAKALYAQDLKKQSRFLEVVLKRAKRFHQALNQGSLEEEKKHAKYVIIGSDCQRTLTRAVIKKADPGYEILFSDRDKRIDEMLYDFGDGSVTKESLLGVRDIKNADGSFASTRLPAEYEIFFCENHGDLALSTTYLDNVLHALLEE